MHNDLKKAVEVLKSGGIILYPTDTIWGIGCDATNEESVAEIYKIKKRVQIKSLVILVCSLEMLKEYVEIIPSNVITFLKDKKEPITVIYDAPKKLAKNTIAIDNTIAIRIIDDGFTHELIKQFGKPIVSTSANISGCITPLCFDDISKEILHEVNYIANLKNELSTGKSSKIIKFVENEIMIIR